MASPSEVTGLQVSLLDTEGRIDQALDKRDRRAFRVWCRRRASLLVRLERALLSLATGPTDASTR